MFYHPDGFISVYLPMDYELLSILNRGSYGDVVEVVDGKNRKKALKICKKMIPSKMLNPDFELRYMYNEVEILKFLDKIDHPNLLGSSDFYIHNKKIHIFFDVGLLEFKTKIKNNDFDFKMKTEILYEILKGINKLHESGIVHRDLKPPNIMFFKKKDEMVLIPKIIDYGMATQIDDDYDNGKNEIVSRWYRSYELLMGCCKLKRASIDMWSFGCLVGELLIGEPLFRGRCKNTTLMYIIKTIGKLPKHCVFKKYEGKDPTKLFPSIDVVSLDEAGELGKDLILKCLDYDPDKRITAKEALKHPFFNLVYKDDDFKDEKVEFKSTFDHKWSNDKIIEEIEKMI